MPTLKRLSAHLMFFVVLMAAFAALTGVWHRLDYAVYRRWYLPKHVPFSADIMVVDLPRFRESADHADPSDFRLRLADLLGNLAARKPHPDAVALDVVFSNDGRGLPALTAAVDSLTTNEVAVYAVVDPKEPSGGGALLPWKTIWEDQAAGLYQEHLSGYGHTQINSPYMGVLSYDTQLALELPDGSRMSLLALPLKVVADRNRTALPAARSLVLPLADSAELAAHTYRFEHAAGATSGGRLARGSDTTSPALGGAIVVVGSFAADAPGAVSVAGPMVVASAISAQLTGGGALQPIDHPGLLLLQILVFGALTAAAFALLFEYLKRLQTHPVLTAVLSAIIALAGLAGTAAAGRLLGFATPVGLPLFAIGLAALLAWHFALKFLVTGLAEGSGKYDVFISYSRQQGDWVVANVLEPLKAMRKSDGSPLAIYFDKESISIGEAFTTKYMWAIVDSTFFLPVFSPEYYGKMHCSNEMDLAYKRAMDKRVALLPVATTLAAVPAIYSHLNIAIADQNAAFFEGIRKRLLQPDPPMGVEHAPSGIPPATTNHS
jgi:hypothetical protein